jgi:hypothetical protein
MNLNNKTYSVYTTNQTTPCNARLSGIGILAGFIGFFYFLSTAHKGPWHGKFDMGAKAREQTKDFGPEFASQFKIETHPAFRKDLR